MKETVPSGKETTPRTRVVQGADREAWEVTREGSVLHVRIAGPVTDWAAIFDVVSGCLSPRPDAVALPAELPRGSATDTEMLRTMWGFLMDLGLTVYRDSTPPASAPLPSQRKLRGSHPLRPSQQADWLPGL